jgi:hypothetical protein
VYLKKISEIFRLKITMISWMSCEGTTMTAIDGTGTTFVNPGGQ